MKKMTRIAALLAAAVLTLCLTACGGGRAEGIPWRLPGRT